MKLKDVISTADMERCGERTLPVLSMTMHDGIVLQADRFKKAIASKDLSSYKVVRRNQLVVSFPIDEGVLYIQDLVDAGIVSPAYAIWDIHANMVYPRYLGMFLRSPRSIQYYKSKLRGSTARRRTIPRDDFLCMELPEVSIAEQRKICTTLEKIKIVISECEQQINRLGEIVKSRFVEMFGNVKSSVAIGERFKTQSGGTPKSSENKFYENGTIPWLTSGEVGQGVIRKVDRCITQAGLDNSSAKWTPIDSVLVAMYGATAGKVGLLKIKATTNQAVCSILPAQGMMPEFVYYAVASKTEWMLQQAAGGAQPNISQGVVRKMRIPNPPLALQREFAAFVAKVDKLAFAARRRRDVARQLYRAKIQEFFG